MEIHRRNAGRPGAEIRVMMHEREPEVAWDAETGNLVLRSDNVPSWKDDGGHYDYRIFLSPSDLEQIRTMLSNGP